MARRGALLASLLAVSACHPVPPGRVAVTSLEVDGNEALGEEELEKKIVTRESPKFLGLFRGVVFDQEVFDSSLLQQDIERLERHYRARGFYSARVRAVRVFDAGEDKARVALVVDEGPPVLIRSIELRGLEGLPKREQEELRKALSEQVTVGGRFEEADYLAGERKLRRWLNDRGFAWATAQRSAFVDMSRNAASVIYEVEVGPPAVFGKVELSGLGDLPRSTVLRVLDIESGEKYSQEQLDEARQALLDLGVFSAVEIEPRLEGADRSRPVDLLVRLERGPMHSGHLGGGFELTQLETNVHLTTAWNGQNFLGGLRTLSAEFEPGLVLYPTRVPSFDKPTHFLPKATLRLRLRQPAFLEARTYGHLRVQASAYPVLLVPDVSEGDPVLGYFELRESAGVERRFWKVTLAPSLNVQQNVPFAYVGEIDPTLQMLRLSYLEVATSLDLRDDINMPHAGAYSELRLQATAGRLGPDDIAGHVSDFKALTELRGYVPLGRRTTLGLRGTIGALWPENWGDTLDDEVPSNDDIQISYFRSFFSGGPNSNRGWPLRGIGKQGIAPFLSPGLTQAQLATQCTDADPDDVQCRTPFGGLTLWEASLELRRLFGKLEGVVFCDASDVNQEELTYAFDPHLSCGSGVRYVTPIGPLRFDVAYRIPGLNPTEAEIQAGEDGDPGEIFGLPIGLVLGLGEAF